MSCDPITVVTFTGETVRACPPHLRKSLSNHVHLLIRPLETSISRIMQVVLGSHTQRYYRCHHSSGHVWQGRFKSPVIQDDDHLLTVLRYIEANPLRAGIVDQAGAYRWSSFAAHGLGRNDPPVDRLKVYESLAKTAPGRRRRWSASIHQSPSDEDLSALRRSVQTGLPFGEPGWVEQLGHRLDLDLTIRARGRPRKAPNGQDG